MRTPKKFTAANFAMLARNRQVSACALSRPNRNIRLKDGFRPSQAQGVELRLRGARRSTRGQGNGCRAGLAWPGEAFRSSAATDDPPPGAWARGTPVSVCGEIAGDAHFTPLLLALGVEAFSMHPDHLPAVRHAITQLDRNTLRARLPGLWQANDHAQMAAWLDSVQPD